MNASKPQFAVGLPTSDATLVMRIAAGDLNALGTLYDRYARLLLRFARRIEPPEAEDIVQTVFLRVVRLAGSFDGQSATARPWLYAITARVMQERRRALGRWSAMLVRLSREPRRRVSPVLDMRHDLDAGLARLTLAKRTVLVLSEVEGFGCEEIARLLQIPVGTVWTRLHHARNELRAFQEEEP
jgi:RNA polymerase sigma-70 factor (ECF subfamily)